MKRLELLKQNSEDKKLAQLDNQVKQEKAELELQLILQSAKVKQSEADLAERQLALEKTKEAQAQLWGSEKFNLKKIIDLQNDIENAKANVDAAKSVLEHNEKWWTTMQGWLEQYF